MAYTLTHADIVDKIEPYLALRRHSQLATSIGYSLYLLTLAWQMEAEHGHGFLHFLPSIMGLCCMFGAVISMFYYDRRVRRMKGDWPVIKVFLRSHTMKLQRYKALAVATPTILAIMAIFVGLIVFNVPLDYKPLGIGALVLALLSWGVSEIWFMRLPDRMRAQIQTAWPAAQPDDQAH